MAQPKQRNSLIDKDLCNQTYREWKFCSSLSEVPNSKSHLPKPQALWRHQTKTTQFPSWRKKKDKPRDKNLIPKIFYNFFLFPSLFLLSQVSNNNNKTNHVFPRNRSSPTYVRAEDCCCRRRDAHDGWYLQPVSSKIISLFLPISSFEYIYPMYRRGGGHYTKPKADLLSREMKTT